MKLLVHSIQGPENSVNAVFPIAIASMAAEAGHEVNIFLAGNAVSLMKTEIVENMSAIGVGKLSDYIKVIKDKELKFIYLQVTVKQEVLPKMMLKIRMELCQDLQDY